MDYKELIGKTIELKDAQNLRRHPGIGEEVTEDELILDDGTRVVLSDTNHISADQTPPPDFVVTMKFEKIWSTPEVDEEQEKEETAGKFEFEDEKAS